MGCSISTYGCNCLGVQIILAISGIGTHNKLFQFLNNQCLIVLAILLKNQTASVHAHVVPK